MAFRYNVLCIENVFALPLKCNCKDKKKWQALQKGSMEIWKKQDNKKISIEGVEYDLVLAKYQPNFEE